MNPEKSPVRVAIETYIAEAPPGTSEWVKNALIDVAKVATEQEYDRCIHQLMTERPILTRTNNWRTIIGDPPSK